jgi:ABC-type multidrug transport system fused ATPase/permease subunit
LSGDAPEVNSLAESTYGLHTSSYDVNNAIVALQGFYNMFDARCYGKDYRITFTTAAKRDGKPHPVKLSVNKVAQFLPPFTAPDMTFADWMQENTVLFIVLIALFMAIVILTIWLVRRGITERNRKIEENKASLQGEIDKANQDMEVMKRKHEEEKRRQAAEAAQKEKAAEEHRLKTLMRTKNFFPRLQCKCPDSSFSFSISQPRITIGRNNDNDLVLNHQTVSGYHADIIFNGTSFEIVNKSRSYTQGVIVNGQFFQKCTLKSGDMIGLGEAVITFYI